MCSQAGNGGMLATNSRTRHIRAVKTRAITFALLICAAHAIPAQEMPAFHVIAFFTAKEDQAHISFTREAVRWFPEVASKYHFDFDTTSDWRNINTDYLSQYQVVVFLDTRPEDPTQRAAFESYMEHGGAWMGFHFAGFALTPSAVPANWSWYHDELLGAGSYVSNTWRPTSATLRVEDRTHPATAHLPATFRSSPNEWYRWEHDLRLDPDIDILVSIDSTSFPLGTGPKPEEIWHSGYYPVVWTNRKYRMIYFNMGQRLRAPVRQYEQDVIVHAEQSHPGSAHHRRAVVARRAREQRGLGTVQGSLKLHAPP